MKPDYTKGAKGWIMWFLCLPGLLWLDLIAFLSMSDVYVKFCEPQDGEEDGDVCGMCGEDHEGACKL